MSFSRDMVLRYTFQGGRHGFSRLVARASMLAMVIGVASLITVLSVMNGFAGELQSRILALVPHVLIKPKSGALEEWVGLAASLERHPGVQGVAPFVEDVALLQAWTRRHGSRVTGIDLSAQRRVSDLHEHVVAGDLAGLEQTPFTLAIGSGLARQLAVSVGDSIDIVLPTLTVTPLGTLPRTRELRLVAVFEVGSSIDAQQSYVSLETARRLFARPGVDGLQVDLGDAETVGRRSGALRTTLGDDYVISDWRSSQGSLFAAVRMEKIMVGVLLLAVVAVAAFNIVSTLTMSVTEKSRDIAVLRVMGVTSRGILWIFFAHGVLLGLLGIIVGAILGIALSLNISELALLLEKIVGFQLFDPTVYYIGRLPAELEWLDVVVTVVIALSLSALATLYPAWRAANILPTEVLDHG